MAECLGAVFVVSDLLNGNLNVLARSPDDTINSHPTGCVEFIQ